MTCDSLGSDGAVLCREAGVHAGGAGGGVAAADGADAAAGAADAHSHPVSGAVQPTQGTGDQHSAETDRQTGGLWPLHGGLAEGREAEP